MPYYIGILDGAADVWGVRVPDLPGVHGGGDTAELAISDAISAALDWAEHNKGMSRALPAPRTAAEILAAGEVSAADGELLVQIPLLLDSGRTVRANLTMDAGLLAAIDDEAARRGLTRSAFLASAARDKIVRGGMGLR